MELNIIERIIIDEFKIFGDAQYPGCSPPLENQKIYKLIQEQLLIRLNVHMTVAGIEKKWKELKEKWIEHHKNIKHQTYRGERCTYQCPGNLELCIRLSFISICDCYRHLYKKHQAALVRKTVDIETITID